MSERIDSSIFEVRQIHTDWSIHGPETARDKLHGRRIIGHPNVRVAKLKSAGGLCPSELRTSRRQRADETAGAGDCPLRIERSGE